MRSQVKARAVLQEDPQEEGAAGCRGDDSDRQFGGRDDGAGEKIGEQIDTGTFFLNRCDYLDPALAWTGVKDTGRGATLSRVGYEFVTRPKSYHLRTKTK